ncbi:MAG: hypothetical protein LBB59_04495 [Campylobacteraceae bacterium]|jgi:hypothetical protein|nr:hypothetical protein [Campylobacteraceae bacterium]
MADYVIQGVPNQDGNLLSTPIVDVKDDSSFKVQEVLDADGKKIAVPVAVVGALSSGDLVPPSVIISGTTSTAATKTASTQIFDLSSSVLFFSGSGSIAAEAKATNAFYYEFYYSSGNIQYAFNGFASTDFNKQLYLVGTITGGGFKLDQTSVTSWYTTVKPTSANGKVYLPLGVVGDNANVFNLMNTGAYMQYKNGVFAPVGFYGL